MNAVLKSIEAEYRRYKAVGECVLTQLSDDQVNAPEPSGGNSVAVIAWHVAGNFKSRFTDFLTSDGEKPWRDRESEFAPRTPTRDELLDYWEQGWRTVLDSLAELDESHLASTVTIRGTELGVLDALHRSMAHASYHVGQMVYRGKALRGADWEYWSIPPGASEAYNANPTGEKVEDHIAHLNRSQAK